MTETGQNVVLLLGGLSPASGLPGALVLTAVGLIVVFTTLVVLAVLISLLGRLRDRNLHPAPGVRDTGAGPGSRSNAIDPRHLVVIAAAAAAVGGSRARVHRVVILGRQSGRQWVTEGRVVVMGSHRLHR